MNSGELLQFTSNGIYCRQADLYIDPWRKVPKALITHAHSDHARWGHGSYLSSERSVPILKHRLGNINVQGLPFEKRIEVNGVKISFHPAGHIYGSSQIRLEHKGKVSVVTGDYKLHSDGISEEFSPVKCDTLITECTFGLPCFQWQDPQLVYQSINEWWARNRSNNINSVLFAYSLGKAQRLIQNLDHSIGEIFTHGAVENINEVLRDSGVKLKQTRRLNTEKKFQAKGALIIAPGSANASWLRKLKPYETAFASGWMALRGARRRRAADRGFILSDHADWSGLNQAILESGAEKVYTTHGYQEVFAEWLRSKGLEALSERTEFGDGEENPGN